MEHGSAKFKIDIGTNNYYRLKIGKTLTKKNGISWVDTLSYTSPMQKLKNDGYLFNTEKMVELPSQHFDPKNCYAQLFSFKTTDGKSPAFSKAIKILVALNIDSTDDFIRPFSVTKFNDKQITLIMLNTTRNIPHTLPKPEYSTQASFEDILANVLRVAGPVVMGLLNGVTTSASTPGSVPAAGGAVAMPQLGMLNTIINTLLQSLTGSGAAATTPTVPTASAVSSPHSLSFSQSSDNRFVTGRNESLSHPFIFGIDDAIIGALAGPIISSVAGPLIQAIPQMLNSMNQQKLQMRQANNNLMTNLVADTNRRMMLQQFLQNQQAQPNNALNSIDVNQLLQLLQQIPATTTTPTSPVAAAPIATPVVAHSLSVDNYYTTLSTNVILVFESANQLLYNGLNKTLFNKTNGITLRLKLALTGVTPKNPLAKAIITIYFKEKGSKKIVVEKSFKQKNIFPHTLLEFAFTANELAVLNIQTDIQILAEMRWQSSTGRVVKALGSTEIILVDNSFLKEQANALVEEKELNDMKIYRSFWNKIWESPVLDATSSRDSDNKKYNWELDITARYSVMLTSINESNGLMETKFLLAKKDDESLTDRTEGRLKAGIELSIMELNKMCTLWDHQQPLSSEKLSALKNSSFIENNNCEFISTLKLKGKRNQRGMVWVIPILKLYNLTLSTVKTSNAFGQITEVQDEQVQFPLPTSARILGLKSNS